MNCVQFEQQVHDLTLERLDEAALDEALAHAELCAGCAQLLADSRALRSSLRALAQEVAEDGAPQAPPRVETVLLAAFRRERRAQVIRLRRKRWALIGIAAAAALLTALGLRQWRGGSGQGTVPDTVTVAPAQPRMAAGEAVAASAAAKTPSSSESRAGRPGPPRTSGKALKHRATPVRPMPQPQNRQSVGGIEWATDFLPLPGADGVASPDAGELVQIDLPRSALAELGLPSVEARAETPGQAGDDTVTAEVFIGDDGVARAIRFAR